MSKSSIAAIVLNWNDADLLPHSVGSLLKQTKTCDVIIVDNGSTDNSRQVIKSFDNKITPLFNSKNRGFAGGVNTGIQYALEQGYQYIALLNNDAVADKQWVEYLEKAFAKNKRIGGVTCAIVHSTDKTYDSTGDTYTNWGLPYPRGRGEVVQGQYDSENYVTAISGGASMFSAQFFQDVGLFDEDFFAYYEDIDLGLRGQLKGWRFYFAPKATVLHATGSTSKRVQGFTTYQTFKNLPWLLVKNVPVGLYFGMAFRLKIALFSFLFSAMRRRQLRYALKGIVISIVLLPKKLAQRTSIQRSKSITTDQFSAILTHDLPPNAMKLRKLRSKYRKLRGKL